MSYLVQLSRNATAAESADALEAAFVHLAIELLAPMDKLDPEPRFDSLRKRLDQRVITLSKWRGADGLIETAGGEWDRGEIATNLRQIEIIILSLRSHVFEEALDVTVNPTQQGGFDATGTLPEGPWVLEVFGGANVSNNNKLALDAKSLASAPLGTRMFFACRPGAWTWAGRSRAGEYGSFDNVHSDRERVLVFEYSRRGGD